MNDASNLISLPSDILGHLSHYLGPHDLLSLSATCRYLRSTFNDDWYWRKYTHGGHVSESLDATTSLVEPVFTNPQTVNSLEPLCQHRLHFLKQSRLLNNLREETFVQHSTEFFGFLSDLDLNHVCGNQKTYMGIYLFTIDYISATSPEEVLKVFNIKREPYLISTFKLIAQEEEYAPVIMGVEIVGDKLVIMKDDWFDVYRIQVSLETLHFLHSININGDLYDVNSTVIVRNCLFVDKGPSNLQTWDIESGETLGIVNPTNEQKAGVLCYSEDRKHILFYIHHPERAENKHLNCCAYDIVLNIFKRFSVPSSYFSSNQEDLIWLVDSKYAVLFGLNDGKCSITVYDYVDSNLVIELKHVEGYKLNSAKIVKNSYLLLPSLFSVKVMDISTLETLWELNLGNCSQIPQVPENNIIELEYINRSNLCQILVVRTQKGRELWDLEKRRRFFFVNTSCGLGINENCSKIITVSNFTLTVFSFW